jgi:hypothetical protein
VDSIVSIEQARKPQRKLRAIERVQSSKQLRETNLNVIGSVQSLAADLDAPISLWASKFTDDATKAVASAYEETHKNDTTWAFNSDNIGVQDNHQFGAVAVRSMKNAARTITTTTSSLNDGRSEIKTDNSDCSIPCSTPVVLPRLSSSAQLNQRSGTNTKGSFSSLPRTQSLTMSAAEFKQRQKTQQRKVEAMQLQMRKDATMQEFMVESSSAADKIVFPATYRCPHKDCNQVFSRAYTFKMHMRSHENFSRYHEYKRHPQLYLDADIAEMNRMNTDDFTASVSLSADITQQLAVLQQRR